MAKVTIVHPDLERTAEVDEEALPVHARAGWVLADTDGQPVAGWQPPEDRRGEDGTPLLEEITEPAPPLTPTAGEQLDDEAGDGHDHDTTDQPHEGDDQAEPGQEA